MKYKIRTIMFLLLAPWLSTNALAQTYNFTVPLEISSLPESVTWFKVECLLLQADGTVAGNSDENVMVDTSSGRPENDQVQIRVSPYPDSSERPTRYRCSIYLPGPDFLNDWMTPSSNTVVDMQPAPGSVIVDEVSGELPAPELPIRQPRG